MSRPHQYHQPNAPDSPDDSDSDVELEMQELDPVTAQNGHRLHGDGYRKAERTERQIPLRSLRVGRTRGFGRQKYSHDGLGGEQDSQALLDETSGQRDSAGSLGTAEDDAPLLQSDVRRGSGVYDDGGRRGSCLPSCGYQASCQENKVSMALLLKTLEQRKAAQHHEISA